MMTDCVDAESLTSRRVLPPIVRFEKDRRFLRELDEFVEAEIAQFGSPRPEHTFMVHRAVFDKVIDYVSAYKPLLTSIKREYEEVIESVKKGHKEAFFLRGKIQALASQPTTIANYRRRCQDLEATISRLQAANQARQANAEAIRAKIKEKEERAKEVDDPTPRVVRRDRRLLPGFSLGEMTDLPSLGRELIGLDAQIRELELSRKTKFLPREQQERLKRQLTEKVERRELSADSLRVVQARNALLNVALEAARAFNKIMPFHQNIAEAVMKALRRHARSGSRNVNLPDELSITGTSAADDEDPAREQESEVIFEYLEKFNELVEEERFEEAARHAANSPRGILRSLDIFLRFEGLERERSQPGLLLAFCEALLAVAPAVRARPPADLSFRCVECALAEGRHDLVKQWVRTGRLTFSELLGDLLTGAAAGCPTERLRTQFFDLGALVLDQAACVAKALACHVEAGRFETALDYAEWRAEFGTDGYLELLRAHPHEPLAHGLLARGLAPLREVSAALTEAGQFEGLAVLLNRLMEEEARARPGKSTPRIVNEVMEEASLAPEAWEKVVDSCPSHLPYLFDVFASGLVTDVLASSLSVVLNQ